MQKENFGEALKKLLFDLEKRTAKAFKIKQSQVTAYWDGTTIEIKINR
jgi:hypothetical protein